MVQVTSTFPAFEKPRLLRICFQKTGPLQYISHLDLVRTMTRVIARAHLPIKYTEGFHPIPHLVFSAPLPVGAQSPREFLDIEVLSPVNFEDVKARLNDGLPEGLAVGEVYYAETKLRTVTSAEYLLRIRTAAADAAMADACVSALSAKPLMVFKHTKGGDRNVDVSENILGVSGSYEEERGEICLAVHLAATGGSFLNPDYLIAHLKEKLAILGGSEMKEGYDVIRTHIFSENGEDFA